MNWPWMLIFYPHVLPKSDRNSDTPLPTFFGWVFFFSHCRQIWLNLSYEALRGWLLFVLDKRIRCILMVAMSGILSTRLKFSLDYTSWNPAWVCVRLALGHLESHQDEYYRVFQMKLRRLMVIPKLQFTIKWLEGIWLEEISGGNLTSGNLCWSLAGTFVKRNPVFSWWSTKFTWLTSSLIPRKDQ